MYTILRHHRYLYGFAVICVLIPMELKLLFIFVARSKPSKSLNDLNQ